MPSQSALARELSEARERTDELFRIVRPDSLYERPIPERHRIIFYIGHLEAFDWNLIGRHALGLAGFHPEFDKLFAFGIDPPPGELPSDKPSDWPSLAEVERYNGRTRDEIDAALAEVAEQFLHTAIEHRLMHAETFAYILHNMPYASKRAQAPIPEKGDRPIFRHKPAENAPVPVFRTIEIPAGTAQLGLGGEQAFGWDNEFQAHAVDVPAFSIGKYKVTNGEYLEFVRAGAEAPFFWTDQGGRWSYRGMFGEIPLPLDWPVYVTQRQATEYAQWRGMRLPTEAEFHRAAEYSPASTNLDFRRWDPMPVNADDRGNGVEHPMQLIGNGWEWTSTVFAPFPGFQPFPYYTNYSEPFFDRQHYVLKGASPRTAARLARPSFRNWFRGEYPYIYATFRLVEP